jgi:7-carboxy-7-deazaguanine synthase
MSIPLSEDFLSIQGEGERAGIPSIFLRFGGCNLQCQGFGVEYFVKNKKRFGCDSFFSVDRDFSSEWKTISKISEFIEILNKYPQNISDVVLTGGEPLLYGKQELFLELLNYLKSSGKTVTIETNGTIKIDKKIEFQGVYFSISPKLEVSGEILKKGVSFSAMKSYQKNSEKNFLKFTLRESSEIIHEFHKEFPKIPIYCMALSGNKEELEKNAENVVKFAIEHGYRYSDRLHIRLWGDERGR